MPLFWISLAIVFGIFLGANVGIPMIGWTILGIAGLLLSVPRVQRWWVQRLPLSAAEAIRRLRIPSLVFFPVMLVFISLGAMRYQISLPSVSPASLSFYNDQPDEIILEGVVVDPPDTRDTYTNLRLRVNRAKLGESSPFVPVNGLLLVKTSQGDAWRYGDRLRLQGRLETPPQSEDFSYRDYLARQSIYSMMAFPQAQLLQHGQGNPFFMRLYDFRQKAQDVIYSSFPDPEASLVAGIVLGIQTGIPEDVQEAFRLTGTSHIIVISGFNITIIAGMFTMLFSRLLGRYKGAVAAALGIILYTLLVGANAAVVRAAILGLLTLLGHLLGRRQAGLNSLAFAACVMAIITPTVLWDVSFQLSFAATLGIMLYAEPFTDWFTRWASRFITPDKAEKLAGPVGEYFLLTLAAQLTTLPLMIYYFKRISLTALIANPLILPAQPALMVIGGLSVLSGVILRPVGQIFAWAAWPFAAYTIRVVEWLATFQHGSLPLGQVALPSILIFYSILFVISLTRTRLSVLATRLTPAAGLSGLAIITFLVWKAALYAPDNLLHVTILNLGTGDGVLIQSPAGRNVLINGGSSTVKLSDALGRRLPPFHRALDWLVIADIDNEDLSGIPANLERFPPSGILWSGNTYGSRASVDLWTDSMSLSIPITRMQAGESLDLGDGATLEVFSIDARGAVLSLQWNQFRMLLPMGMDFEALEAITDDTAMRNISVVLLAESGYAPLNTPELISSLHPQLALLSVAAADRSGLPSPETLEALEGYNLLRTDENGWIQVTTDGKQMWVEVERK